MAALSVADKTKLRERCKTDLYFLAKTVLKKGLTEKTHRPITDFFVQKSSTNLPKKCTQEELQACIGALDSQKERLLLYPRGFYKSTLDGIDCLQWVINFPDIRILIVTGVYALAEQFMYEFRQYVTLAPHGEPTLFQQLFPEFCISPAKGSALEYRCPVARLGLAAPAVWINSLDSTLSGFHCDIMKTDDIVTDANSYTVTQREKVVHQFDQLKYLLDPHGFLDMIGTRYAPDDLYGITIERNEQSDEKKLKYLCGQAWTQKNKPSTDKLLELREEDVDLLFPEKFSFKALRKRLMEAETEFRCQLLNEPVFTQDEIFNIDDLRRATIPVTSFPENGDIFITWDWAHSSKKSRDYSCGVVAKIKDDRIFVLDILQDRFMPDELAYQIVNLIRIWNPRRVLIEGATGHELLALEVQRNALVQRVATPIDWFKMDCTANAKLNRVKALQPLIKSGRLFFSSSISCIDQAYRQFVRFTGERGRKDDIPDAVSFLHKVMPGSLSYRQLTEQEEDARKEAIGKGMYKTLFPDHPVIANQAPEEVELFAFNL